MTETAGGKDKVQENAGTETHGFEAEVSKLLHLMVHSVYSNRDVFLRELVSNASDACERLRHETLAAGGTTPAAPLIVIDVDADDRRLSVSDNGIGMSHDELIANLGTIARSGTRAFIDTLSTKDGAAGNELIGQFGVGFYAAFMVAD
ncbi:MAG: ATP-binding protein, partial [Hyphomicrobiales bacterium]|nr:ATP-binding protein [Hyphomicrobiales bacterium]